MAELYGVDRNVVAMLEFHGNLLLTDLHTDLLCMRISLLEYENRRHLRGYAAELEVFPEVGHPRKCKLCQLPILAFLESDLPRELFHIAELDGGFPCESITVAVVGFVLRDLRIGAALVECSSAEAASSAKRSEGRARTDRTFNTFDLFAASAACSPKCSSQVQSGCA
jgi:hypothetical protein